MSTNLIDTNPELILDPKLKIWTLLPISFVMILVGVIRQCIAVFVGKKVKTVPRVRLTEIMYLTKAKMLLGNGSNLSAESFKIRQDHWAHIMGEQTYSALKPDQTTNRIENPFTNPGMNDALTSMAMSNLLNYIPQTLIMWWVNYFFAGFVLMKLPFPLTLRFKQMLQSSVMTNDLDVRWVSSMSWYIISMAGLTPVYNILYGDSELSRIEISPLQLQLNQSSAGPSASEQMKALSNDIVLFNHESIFDGIEQRVLNIYS